MGLFSEIFGEKKSYKENYKSPTKRYNLEELRKPGKHSKLRKRGRPWNIRRELEWTPTVLVRWIKSCRADGGQPRFMRFGRELEDKHIITAVCWGGENKNDFAKTATFINIGDTDKTLLMDGSKPDWIQLINKYGQQKTKVELLHKGGYIDIKLSCPGCNQ